MMTRFVLLRKDRLEMTMSLKRSSLRTRFHSRQVVVTNSGGFCGVSIFSAFMGDGKLVGGECKVVAVGNFLRGLATE